LLNRAFVWASDRLGLSATGGTAFAEVVWASGNYFDVLDIQAILGRTFDA
jgi:hypothetical protein